MINAAHRNAFLVPSYGNHMMYDSPMRHSRDLGR